MTPRSQVYAIGAPTPKTWDDYEHGCLMTFGGGYQTDEERSIFQHGMVTVFNLLRAEFPPAEQIARGDLERMRAAIEEVSELIDTEAARLQAEHLSSSAAGLLWWRDKLQASLEGQ